MKIRDWIGNSKLSMLCGSRSLHLTLKPVIHQCQEGCRHSLRIRGNIPSINGIHALIWIKIIQKHLEWFFCFKIDAANICPSAWQGMSGNTDGDSHGYRIVVLLDSVSHLIDSLFHLSLLHPSPPFPFMLSQALPTTTFINPSSLSSHPDQAYLFRI